MTVGTSRPPRPALGDEKDRPGRFRDRDLPECLHPRAWSIKLYRKECREACCSIPRMFGGLRGEPGRAWEGAWRPAGETAPKCSLISPWPLMPLWRRPGGSVCPEPLLPALFSATTPFQNLLLSISHERQQPSRIDQAEPDHRIPFLPP